MFYWFFYTFEKIDFTILILLKCYVVCIFVDHRTYKIMIYISYISHVSHISYKLCQLYTLYELYKLCKLYELYI